MTLYKIIPSEKACPNCYSKYISVRGKKIYCAVCKKQIGTVTDTQKLINKASALYGSIQAVDFITSIKVWQAAFTHDELAVLWTECKNDLNLPFDDEVYEALNLQTDSFVSA